MKNYKKITIRFDLDDPIQRRAWQYYLNRDKKEHKSVQRFFSETINAFFDKQLESERISELVVQKLMKHLNAGMLAQNEIQPMKNTDEEDGEDGVDWNFLGDE